MVNIIFFLLIMMFWYGVAVCVVQTVKHCTTREAASFCIQKIKEKLDAIQAIIAVRLSSI